MLLIPAIDIKNSQCVRLRQGRMDDETVFSDDPLQMAQRWADAGAQRIHLVDLDGAVAGAPVNLEVIRRISAALPHIDLQVGGGIRDEDTADNYIACGVRFLIIGTRAVREPHFVSDLCLSHPGRIIVGLDAREGKLATDGWAKTSGLDAIEMAQRVDRDGVAAIVYTDISRDGMMQGLNVAATARLAEAVNVPVIASGGVTDIRDLEALSAVEDSGVNGVIIGRALYEGGIDLSTAIQRFGA